MLAERRVSDTPGTHKPYIRLRGKWLERAGFKPGQRVEIRTFEFNPGQLLLVAT